MLSTARITEVPVYKESQKTPHQRFYDVTGETDIISKFHIETAFHKCSLKPDASKSNEDRWYPTHISRTKKAAESRVEPVDMKGTTLIRYSRRRFSSN
jgi:hypothetical protein